MRLWIINLWILNWYVTLTNHVKILLLHSFCRAGWEPGNMATQYVFYFFCLVKLVYVRERGGVSNADLVNQKHGKDGCKEVDGADNGS